MAEVNKTNLRLVTRLIESGITSEKQIMALKLKDILSIPNITKPELTALCELLDEIKSVGILAFLAKPEANETREKIDMSNPSDGRIRDVEGTANET